MATPALDRKTPSGIWGAVLLAISEQGAIEWKLLREQLEILCKSDLHGIYTNGTAGEFHNQTDDEFYRLTELVADIANAHKKDFQIGVSHSNPRVARARLEHAVQFNPTGVQFTLPDWWTLSPQELRDFALGMQSSAAETPLILYNPPHAKHKLSAADILSLNDLMPSLVGVKLAAGDSDWYARSKNLLDTLSVFVPGHTVAFGRPLGARGSYSNVACLSPNGAAWHWQLVESDAAAAVELESRINRFMQTHVVSLATKFGLGNGALDKLMAAAGGWAPIAPDLLWPYHSATKQQVIEVGQAARAELPELFDR